MRIRIPLLLLICLMLCSVLDAGLFNNINQANGRNNNSHNLILKGKIFLCSDCPPDNIKLGLFGWDPARMELLEHMQNISSKDGEQTYYPFSLISFVTDFSDPSNRYLEWEYTITNFYADTYIGDEIFSLIAWYDRNGDEALSVFGRGDNSDSEYALLPRWEWYQYNGKNEYYAIVKCIYSSLMEKAIMFSGYKYPEPNPFNRAEEIIAENANDWHVFNFYFSEIGQ